MIAIIGGGISGLSLAYFLAQKGEQVSIYEQSDQLGGVCASIRLGETTVDSFYHVLSGGENSLRRLIREVGLEQALFPINLTQGFFRDGKIYPASTMKELLFFQAFGMADRLRMALTVLRAVLTRNWRALDQLTAREWLVGMGGESLYERFWRPIMFCKFGTAAERVVAADMWFRIRRLGVVTLLGEGGGPCYLKGTLRALFDALAAKLKSMGVPIYLNTPVRRLNIEGNCIRSIEIGVEDIIETDRVVSAIPVSAFARLLPESLSQYRAELNRIEYLSNISLILKTTQPISCYYQLNLGHADIPFTGVIGAECLYPPKEFGGYVTYLPRYFQGHDGLFEMDAADLLDQYMPYLKWVCPAFQKDWIKDMTVARTRYADVLRPVGFASMIPKTQTLVKGLFLLAMAQIYPEPTVLDTAVASAYALATRLSRTEKTFS